MVINIEFAKLFEKAKKYAINRKRECYYPNCNNEAINSHILQKNGILNQIAKDRHIWEHKNNLFKEELYNFSKTGINKVFSFKCFCKNHDSELFKEIEQETIDFTKYKTSLLFTVRAIYNELFRKEVNVEVLKKVLSSDIVELDARKILERQIKEEQIGIQSINKEIESIWNDINNESESYVFQIRDINLIEICLTGFFTYDTTKEIRAYREFNNIMENDVADIFISFFPFNGKSKLIMGYKKNNERKVKPYVNMFFKESEKRVQRRLTNVFLFNCETWVVSENLYRKRFEKVEEYISFAGKVVFHSNNERKMYPLNMFKDSFENDLNKWRSKIQTV